MAKTKKTKNSPTKKQADAKKKAAPKKQAPPAAGPRKMAPPKTAPNPSPGSHVASRKSAPTHPSPGNSTTAPMPSVAVPNAGPTNDGSTHGDLTLEGGNTAMEQQLSIAYTNLIVRANDASDLRQAVRDYATQHFFKYVKFITSMKKLLAYHEPATNPNTYCVVITKGCHLPPGTDTVRWWVTVAKYEVKKKVTQMRSD
jgi:hypothetical protein